MSPKEVVVASQTLYASAADADANSGVGQNPIQSSSYTLDLTGERVATRTAQDVDPDTGIVTPRTRTLRYASNGDSPDWTDEGDGTITRNITGANGDLVALATIDKTGAAADALAWQLSDIHGDVAATLPATDTAPLQISRPDEYGAGSDDAPRYGWLGAKQRAGDTPGGLILMGVRLYNPESGRFLTTDPVYCGNPNTYIYPVDPINNYDLDGKLGWRKFWKRAATITGFVAVGACVLATAGLCGIATGAAIAASAGWNLYQKTRGTRSERSRSWGSYGRSFAIDAVTAKFRPVRAFKYARYVPRHSARYIGRHRAATYATHSLRWGWRNKRAHTVGWSAVNAYYGYRSYRNGW